jgi:hypothetical protein
MDRNPRFHGVSDHDPFEIVHYVEERSDDAVDTLSWADVSPTKTKKIETFIEEERGIYRPVTLTDELMRSLAQSVDACNVVKKRRKKGRPSTKAPLHVR